MIGKLREHLRDNDSDAGDLLEALIVQLKAEGLASNFSQVARAIEGIDFSGALEKLDEALGATPK